MDFNLNEKPIEVIRQGALGGTYFRDIYSGISEKWYKNSSKEFHQLKILMLNFIYQIIMM